jgi:hypothetical protein
MDSIKVLKRGRSLLSAVLITNEELEQGGPDFVTTTIREVEKAIWDKANDYNSKHSGSEEIVFNNHIVWKKWVSVEEGWVSRASMSGRDWFACTDDAYGCGSYYCKQCNPMGHG